MTDDFAEYAAAYARIHGLVELSDAEVQRLPALAERAIRAGRGIPRIQDKTVEPMTDFKAIDLARRVWVRPPLADS
ncbi:MAG TPA: hypothetical protein VGC45_02565 [Gryllotalpicola sp.]